VEGSQLDNKEDVKVFIGLLFVANLIGALVYIAKGNNVGIFNCISWSVIAGYILANFNKVFAEKRH